MLRKQKLKLRWWSNLSKVMWLESGEPRGSIQIQTHCPFPQCKLRKRDPADSSGLDCAECTSCMELVSMGVVLSGTQSFQLPPRFPQNLPLGLHCFLGYMEWSFKRALLATDSVHTPCWDDYSTIPPHTHSPTLGLDFGIRARDQPSYPSPVTH